MADEIKPKAQAKKISPEEYARLKGLSGRTAFVVSKMFKGEEYTEEKWTQVIEKKGIKIK